MGKAGNETGTNVAIALTEADLRNIIGPEKNAGYETWGGVWTRRKKFLPGNLTC